MRGVYLRKLNLFTIRQIASKVNTAFLSLWAVCVLLFFSITVFSSGMGLVEVFVGGAERANPYSASLDAAVWYGPAGRRPRRRAIRSSAAPRWRPRLPIALAQAESYQLGHGRRSGRGLAGIVGRDRGRVGPGEHLRGART